MATSAVRVAAAYVALRFAAERAADILRRVRRWQAWESVRGTPTIEVLLEGHKLLYEAIPAPDHGFYAVVRTYWGEGWRGGGDQRLLSSEGDVVSSRFLAHIFSDREEVAKAAAEHVETMIRKYGLPKEPEGVWEGIKHFMDFDLIADLR